MTDHPITPPPELVRQWDSEAVAAEMPEQLYIAAQAARWGANQELEACCAWLCAVERWKTVADRLRSNRRPKPPSLKEKLKEAIYNENLGEALRLAEQLDDSL